MSVDKSLKPIKEQLAYLEKIIVNPIDAVEAMVVSSNFKKSSPAVEAIQQETWYVKGETVNIHRVFVGGLFDPGNYSSIGWVMQCNVNNCMICFKEFTLFSGKSNCFSCGNVVCADCSAFKGLFLDGNS